MNNGVGDTLPRDTLPCDTLPRDTLPRTSAIDNWIFKQKIMRDLY